MKIFLLILALLSLGLTKKSLVEKKVRKLSQGNE